MVSGLWRRSRELQEKYERESERARELELKLALLEQALRTVERDAERALAELHLVQQDHRHLVATVSGRLTQRTAPLDLDRDPFAEIVTLPTEYLDEIAPEDLLDSNADPEQGGEA